MGKILISVKNAVSSETDKQLNENAQSEEKIFDLLYLRYGTRLQVSEKMLSELENCKPPNAQSIESFLISLIIVCEFLEKEGQTVLVTPEKLSKIVTNSFENNLAWEWAKILLKLKEDSKLAFVGSPGGLTFEEAWQTQYGVQILGEFKGWCRQIINLHRTVPLPAQVSTAQGGSRSSSSSNPVKAAAASSVFKCPLCGGNHADKRGRPRRYLAACNSFLEQAINQRWNTIRRLKHCQVCTSAAEHGKYGENCNLKRLACKSCKEL